ncbi:MAG: thiamine pyrophosphate-binding protein [Kiloniellaceae bacterium]
MNESGNLRTGGQILVDQLRIHGAEFAFGVPGESYLAVLDALYDAPQIRYVICRQEGGAAMMAEAYGKLTGRPGICMVTRGPGATNASAGLHIAAQDSTPMILLVGQVARPALEREAFQEIDYRRMFGQMAKWVAQIDDPGRIPEFLARAFATATSGRPGPVVLALPEDMLSERAAAADAAPYRPVQAHPGAADMTRLQELLARAERPFVILGGGGWTARAVADIRAFAEANALPVGVSFRRQDRLDNTHASYAGDIGIGINPKLARRIRDADLLLVVGARLGEIATGGYTLIDIPRPRQTLVHVHADAQELGRVYQPDLAINAGMEAFAAAARASEPVDSARWVAWSAAARRDYVENIEPPAIPGALQMGEVMATLRQTLPPETIVANGAGNYSAWPNRFYQYRSFPSQLGPTSGSMGYATPAAVAAKLVYPERPVVCFTGDGCFLMTGQELATAVQYDLGIVVLLVNNGMYGTIRMHQERAYPGRVLGTVLVNPDFAALARAYGAHGETVERTEDFAPAFERARAAGGPALLDLRIDPEAITPRASLSRIREAALASAGP